MADATPKIPTPEQFFIEYPLYKEFAFSEDEGTDARKIRLFNGTVDAYCPNCENHSIFSPPQAIFAGASSGRNMLPPWDTNQIFTISLICTRNKAHTLQFDIRLHNRKMQKIGQFPSFAALNLFDTLKYKSALNRLKMATIYQEFTKAIGLASHGIGIGSFVYLRRIFESLIEEAHQIARVKPDWDEEAFTKGRMVEKIQILGTYLPDFLVENRSLYGILSKGIHELSEDECLDAFPVVKLGIELILDAKIREMEEQKKLDEARKAIQGLTKSI
jgi:hypothetical protein